MKHQRVPMPPQNLAATVLRYNGFVEAGIDAEFDKTHATLQDRQAALLRRLGDAGDPRHPRGLRINARCQVLDMNRAVIHGLYCGGESAGDLSLHGLPRAICQRLIAGRNAAAELGHS
jgi:FAD binding domain